FRTMIGEAGLHGVASPARLPGLWRVTTLLDAAGADALTTERDGARRVTRAQASAQWTFADDAQPVPLAPPLPIVDVPNRDALIRYILDQQPADKLRAMVSIVLDGRSRNGVSPHDARAALAAADTEIYRRAVTATVGRGKRGKTSWDFERAHDALVRLAEGDPALPINSVGQYVELTVDDAQPVEDNWIPVAKPTAV